MKQEFTFHAKHITPIAFHSHDTPHFHYIFKKFNMRIPLSPKDSQDIFHFYEVPLMRLEQEVCPPDR